MSKVVVKTVGPVTSIQDGGRFGAQRYGLTPSGAMDQVSLAAANTLVGCKAFAAAVEIGPWGASFTAIDGAVRFAVAGAERNIDVVGRSLSMNTTSLVTEGDTVVLGPARGGMFSYLAFEGGIAGAPVFGSLSVNARAGLGSPFPRPLQAHDELSVGAAAPLASEMLLDLPDAREGPIRVVMGPQDDEFDDVCKLFLDGAWIMSATRDRMGYRLEGPKIVHPKGHNIVSDGAVFGSIQVPGNGQPIVLMADHGTTGGYPKIATVISADLGRLAQIPSGQEFRFQAIDVAAAHVEARAMHNLITGLSGRLRNAESSGLNLGALQEANLAGVAINAVDTATWQADSISQP